MQKTLSNVNKRINYLYTETTAVYHKIALKFGLSYSAFQIIYTICDNDCSCPLREICRSTGLSKQTVNSALRKLEQNNIVILEKKDAKSKTATLTEAGLHLADHTVFRLLELENDIFSAWSKQDVEIYLNLTERYMNDLIEKARNL